jgi:hypothetical protein
MLNTTKGLLVGLTALVLFPSVAPDQPVFSARKALGLIWNYLPS